MGDKEMKQKGEIPLTDPTKYELTDDQECIDQLINALLLREQCIRNGEQLAQSQRHK